MSILDLASLSILGLLEYDLERREINYALSEGVIAIDKDRLHTTSIVREQEVDILLSGDSYFNDYLNSKVRLTELGMYILDSIKGVPTKIESPIHYSNQYDLSSFNPPIIS